MKVLLVSDSFKGTLKSEEICEIAKETVAEMPDVELRAIPIADGGEGTVDCFARVTGAELVTVPVTGPFSDTTVDATYAVKGYTAVIEMASTCGLPLVEKLGRERDPFKTTTYGTGELILDALDRGCVNILLGLGGSSTNDGGCGCAAALDTRFYDKNGEEFIPVGGTLKNIARIDTTYTQAAFHEVTLTAMCDVDNPTVGNEGAAFVFAPQKGAPEELLFQLDNGLKNLCDVIEKDLSLKLHDMPSGGAAGGMGAGCVAFFDGKIVSGIEAILDAVGFDDLAADADLIITGEGKLDSQSLGGKVISGIAKRAGDTPLVAIVGKNRTTAEEQASLCLRKVYETSDDRSITELAKTAREDYKKTLIKCLEGEM
ncbi:MAG: glycerate kinase [Clostridia bacterium]|nr:glycerate kinase [Clostridia bacterium]